jgi:hypothetical protein
VAPSIDIAPPVSRPVYQKKVTKPRRVHYLFKPQQPLLWLSGRDALTIENAFSGIHVFGSNGSGKSTGSGRYVAEAMCAAGFGGCVIAAKPGDRAFWQELMRKVGREEHLFIIAPDQPWRFNVIAYDLNRASGLSERIDNVMATFDDVLSQAGQTFGGEAQQWINAAKDLMRRAVAILAAAYDSFTYGDIIDFIAEAPESTDKVSAPDFSECRFARIIARAEQRNASQFQWTDFHRFKTYWTRDYPRLPVNTRESARFVLNHLHGSLETGRAKELFGADSTVFPEDSHNGAVIFVDLPASDSANIAAQILFKIVWQGAVLRRGDALRQKLRPVFLWADESHLIVSLNDTKYQSLCRQAGGCTVYLTQNLSSYQQRLPGPDSTAAAHALLGYFQVHVFHAQADTATLKFTQELFDKKMIRLRGVSITTGNGDSLTTGQGDGSHVNARPGRQMGQGRERSESETDSFQEQLHDAVTIRQLTTLKTGGARNGYIVGAFVFNTGRVWRRSKTTYLYTEFAQR